jgi:nucleoside-diphosphate-sugar epimerase
MKNNVYNLGLSSANLTKRELCEKINLHTNNFSIFESEISNDQDKRDYIVSNEKIESFGFEAKFDLDYGINELIKVYNYIDTKFYSNY